MLRHINAVAVHISSVSMNTESICTRPCFTGWETSAVAAALGAEPIPASFEYRPLLIPYIIHEPAKPPNIAWKSKALLNIEPNIEGTFVTLIPKITKDIST